MQGNPGAVGLLTRMTQPEAAAEEPVRPRTMKSPWCPCWCCFGFEIVLFSELSEREREKEGKKESKKKKKSKKNKF